MYKEKTWNSCMTPQLCSTECAREKRQTYIVDNYVIRSSLCKKIKNTRSHELSYVYSIRPCLSYPLGIVATGMEPGWEQIHNGSGASTSKAGINRRREKRIITECFIGYTCRSVKTKSKQYHQPRENHVSLWKVLLSPTNPWKLYSGSGVGWGIYYPSWMRGFSAGWWMDKSWVMKSIAGDNGRRNWGGERGDIWEDTHKNKNGTFKCSQCRNANATKHHDAWETTWWPNDFFKSVEQHWKSKRYAGYKNNGIKQKTKRSWPSHKRHRPVTAQGTATDL